MTEGLSGEQRVFLQQHLGVKFEHAGVAEEEARTAEEKSEESASAARLDDRTRIFQSCHSDWMKGRSALQKALNEVEKTLLAEYVGDEAFGEAKENAQSIYSILKVLDARLSNTLIAAAKKPAKADEYVKAARDITREYISFIGNDPLLDALESDKDLPITMKSYLLSTLNSILVQIA